MTSEVRRTDLGFDVRTGCSSLPIDTSGFVAKDVFLGGEGIEW
jgi:hypothetical protein